MYITLLHLVHETVLTEEPLLLSPQGTHPYSLPPPHLSKCEMLEDELGVAGDGGLVRGIGGGPCQPCPPVSSSLLEGRGGHQDIWRFVAKSMPCPPPDSSRGVEEKASSSKEGRGNAWIDMTNPSHPHRHPTRKSFSITINRRIPSLPLLLLCSTSIAPAAEPVVSDQHLERSNFSVYLKTHSEICLLYSCGVESGLFLIRVDNVNFQNIEDSR